MSSTSDLVSRLRLDVIVGDSPAKVDQVRASVAGLGAAADTASGQLVKAGAGGAAMAGGVAAADAATAAMLVEVRQLAGAVAGLSGTLGAQRAATVANTEALVGSTTATAANALAVRELGAAQAATTTGMAAQGAASKALGGATEGVGAAMGGAVGAGRGLLALVGGPLSAGIAAGTLVMSAFTWAIDQVKEANEKVKQSLATSVDLLGDLKREAEETADYTIKLSIAMGDSASQADLAAGAYDRQAAAASGAARAIRDMTLAQKVQEARDLDKQIEDLTKAQRDTGFTGNFTTDKTEAAYKSRQKALEAAYGNETQRRFTRQSDAELFAQLKASRATLSPKVRKLVDAGVTDEDDLAAANAALAYAKTKREELAKDMAGQGDNSPTLVDEITVTAERNKKTRADTKGFNAGVTLDDLKADVAAEQARTAAVIAGGKALDEWTIKEAGRAAVEKTALADKPKLTAAEAALVAQIRATAEAAEAAKIANERLVKGREIEVAAKADTAALKLRAEAAAQGQAALEELSVKEAGLAALQQLGIDSLDQLTGKTLEQAKAAQAAAEAAQRQAIETAKAEKVATAIQDLEKRIAAEKGYAAALAQGEEALVAYQRAEFVRQEVERAGTTLSKDQVAALEAKAKALFAVQAAADSAALDRSQAEELRLTQLTTREREIEERYLKRKSLLLAQHAEWTKEEVEARARALALAEQAAAEDASAIGKLKDNLRQAFIETGKLSFDDIAEYAKQKLRAAVYDALLAKPIEVVIKAVVGAVSGQTGASGQAGAGGVQSALDKVLGKYLGPGTIGGKALGGAMTGLTVSGLAEAIGLAQNKNNKAGGAIGGAIGAFLPIPGGALIGSVVGNVLGGLLGGKKSNNAAVVSLDASGNISSIGGGKRTDETTAAATSVAQGVGSLQQALIAAGATLKTTVSSIDLGVRDQTYINLSSGQTLRTAVGDTAAAIKAATTAIIQGADFGSQAATAYAQKVLLAGESLETVVATLAAAKALPKSIDDAILELTDPAAFERQSALEAVEASYKALKTQAQSMIDAGLVSGDVLAKIDELRNLQLADTLKQLDEAAARAAAELAEAAAQAAALKAANERSAADLTSSVQLAILKITNPAEYERQSAILGVTGNYDDMVEEAQRLIAAGALSGDILGQLATMRDLQLAEALKNLAGATDDVAAAFEDARPKLRSWLDGLSVSANSPLNAFEQRQAAMASYERQLELARGGSADALSAITSYAEQLLASDRGATDSAADRAALYAKVTADIAALAEMTAAAEAAPSIVTLASADMSAFSASVEASGDKLAGKLDAVAARVAQLAAKADQNSAELIGEIVSNLTDLAKAVSQGFAGTEEALDGLAVQTRLLNATLNRAVLN